VSFAAHRNVQRVTGHSGESFIRKRDVGNIENGGFAERTILLLRKQVIVLKAMTSR